MTASAFVSECLSPLLTFILSQISSIISLYTANVILLAVLALWVFRRIVRVFEYIKP